MNLPDPNTAFRWNRETWGHALRCRPLEALAQHLFTSRQLQLRPSGNAAPAWERVLTSLDAAPERLVRVKQVHGRNVRVVRRGDEGADHAGMRPEADAIVSDVPGAVLAVQVADCIPMLMVDSRTGASAAVHAGWRGTCAGIAAATVETLATEFATNPADLTVALGPSIGVCCYDVGPELVDTFRERGASDADIARWFQQGDDGRLRLDLWTVNLDQLTAAGVAANRIFLSGLCTRTYADVFDSYRAAGAHAGRSVAAIKVPHI